MKQPTFTAIWVDSKKIIYKNMPFGNLYGALPLGAKPIIDDRYRSNISPEEYWDGAEFFCGSGKKIIVKKDK